MVTIDPAEADGRSMVDGRRRVWVVEAGEVKRRSICNFLRP
jgi:hypothetical protein